MITTRAPSHDTAIKHTAAALAPLLESARTFWAFATDAPPPTPAWRCATCHRDAHAASVTDPTCCIRCARPSARPNPYAWRATVFGHIRKVSPFSAACWESEETND